MIAVAGSDTVNVEGEVFRPLVAQQMAPANIALQGHT